MKVRYWGFDYSSYGGFTAHFNKTAYAFGDKLARVAKWGESLKEKLRTILKDDNDEPYQVIRGVYPINHVRTDYAREETWFIDLGLYNIISSGLISLTGNKHRPKLVGETVFRDYRTNWRGQKHLALRDNDLPLRYRTATPELLFPEESVYEKENDLAVRVIVFACIENPILDPIWILPLSRILPHLTDDRLDERGATIHRGEKSLLSDGKFAVYDRLAEGLHQRDLIRNQSILMIAVEGGTWRISIDPNRIAFEDQDTGPEHRAALSRLLSLIESLGQDEESGAIPVVLNAGDALVIDNYRMLYCRKEMPYQSIQPLMFGRPAERWLRSYYGFPQLEIL